MNLSLSPIADDLIAAYDAAAGDGPLHVPRPAVEPLDLPADVSHGLQHILQPVEIEMMPQAILSLQQKDAQHAAITNAATTPSAMTLLL